MLHLFSTVWNSIRRTRKERRGDPRRVRAIPGAIPRSPLELQVWEFLAAHPSCAWPHLVAEVARCLRGAEHPRILAVLDEAFWGDWVWPLLARQELMRLNDVLLVIDAAPSLTGDTTAPVPPPEPANTEGFPTGNCSPLVRG